MMEYEHFISYLASNLHPKMPDDIRKDFQQIDLYQFAQSIIVNLPPPRIKTYLQSDYDKIQKAGKL